jgi:hypothetical protein
MNVVVVVLTCNKRYYQDNKTIMLSRKSKDLNKFTQTWFAGLRVNVIQT